MPSQEHSGSVAAGSSVAPPPDETTRAWVEGLQSTGARHDRCVAELYALLRRVARHEVSRRAGSLQLSGPEADDVAEQAADDALMAIKAKLDGFRGESRFTTWAYRFVVFEVSTKLGRHFWRRRPVPLDREDWERLPDVSTVLPEQAAERHELWAALRRAVAEDLTDLQRRVFVAIAVNEVQMDAFARELGSNRNAVYKVLFDARRKLRASPTLAPYARALRDEESG